MVHVYINETKTQLLFLTYYCKIIEINVQINGDNKNKYLQTKYI